MNSQVAWKVLQPGIRTRSCPFCGRQVIAKDVDKSISHELPECRAFVAMVQPYLSANSQTRVETLHPDTGLPTNECPAQLSANDPGCPYAGAACPVHRGT